MDALNYGQCLDGVTRVPSQPSSRFQSTKLDASKNMRAECRACSVGELGVTAPRTTPSTVEQRSGRSELTAGRLRVGVRHSECGRHSHWAMCSTDLDRTAPQRLSGARRLRPDVAR